MKTILKTMIIASIATSVHLIHALAIACNCCGGWGQDEAGRENVCSSPSAGLVAALHACEESKCAIECSAYNASYDACAASGPPCTIVGSTQDCDFCRRGTAQWTGIGCEAETLACSYDRTGCLTCNIWIHGNTNVDNLCDQAPPSATSIDTAIGVSNCACSGGCAADCSASCVQQGGGLPDYLDSGALQDDSACKLCLAWGACSAAFVSCSWI